MQGGPPRRAGGWRGGGQRRATAPRQSVHPCAPCSDASGEVRAWSLQDLRPVLIRRLHPPAVGVLNLRLLGQHRLLTQGRDGVTHLWALGDSMQLSE